MKLSVLICTIDGREHFFNRLYDNLIQQSKGKLVEILFEKDDGAMSIGTKRNLLMSRAKGDYVAYFDCDDRPSPNYIDLLLKGIESNPDCCSLIGIIRTDGRFPKKFIHSISYRTYFEKKNVYYRPPNHLNCIKRKIAKSFKFPDVDFSEDTDWAMQICNAEVLKTQFEINEVLYHYDYRTKKA